MSSVDPLSVFSKAASDAKVWREITDFATTLEPQLARAFLAAANKLRKSIGAKTLLSWARSGKVPAKLFDPKSTAVKEYQQAVLAAADRAAVYTSSTLPGINVSFVGTPTKTILGQVNRETLKMIREISQNTRDGIVGYIQDGLTRGVNPVETARHLKQIIGVTRRQSKAISNYRRALEKLSTRALDYELRDHRFDAQVSRAIASKKAFTPAQIDKMTQRYADRMLKYRSETIARTESIRAMAAGQRAAWKTAIKEGYYDEKELRRFWYPARGERTCDICGAIPGMNKKGVGIDQEFKTPVGPLYGPTAHPDCRCAVMSRLV